MHKKTPHVLIIKLGLSETFNSEISTQASLGDVLRSTVILHLYKHHHITWLVDAKAYPILKNLSSIDELLIYDSKNIDKIKNNNFDIIINLEKTPTICEFANSIKSDSFIGFNTDKNHLTPNKNNHKFWQEMLFELAGRTWNNEKYFLNQQLNTSEKFDIGFNTQVGKKWPLKAWPKKHWEKLEKLIGNTYSISWQEGLDSVEEYISWINNCKLLITNDSLGLHIGIALKKKIVALFGPTQESQIYLYNLGEKLFPANFKCNEYPCDLKKCTQFNNNCTSLITPEEVLKTVYSILK